MTQPHEQHDPCGCGAPCRCSCSCPCCGCCNGEAGDDARQMFDLAVRARHAVLMTHMEKHVEAKLGDKLDRIAALAVAAVIDKLQRKAQRAQAIEDYQDAVLAAIKDS